MFRDSVYSLVCPICPINEWSLDGQSKGIWFTTICVDHSTISTIQITRFYRLGVGIHPVYSAFCWVANIKTSWRYYITQLEWVSEWVSVLSLASALVKPVLLRRDLSHEHRYGSHLNARSDCLHSSDLPTVPKTRQLLAGQRLTIVILLND